MLVEKFKVDKTGNLVGLIASKFSNLSQNKIRAILRNKDFYYSDIILTKEDLLLLRNYIDDNIKEN